MSNIVFGRTPVRRVLQTSIAVALVAGVVASVSSPAVAAPDKLLQSVSVSLGSDASIESISSTAVRSGADDALSSDEATLDPTEHASALPVRIMTTYRLGDESGTDLSEIEGEAGRVVIDVTVQNITARPERLSYDFNGTRQEQNALVATPMTVVASAQLGEDSLGDVVTSDDVNPDEVTNGVVGRGADRAADVQWAALLAPPRLGASATFRLVQDTDDFRAPQLDLSVQPGMVTDTSVQRLLEAAFAEDPSSTLKLESATIELVGNVNTILTGASGVLVQIQQALGTSASELGQKTISDLESSASLVSSSLSGLAGDLSSLNSQMAGEMSTASSETVQQFEETVGSMKKLLGDPKKFDNPPTVKPVECADELPALRTAGSITEQMIAITAQMQAMKTATTDCREEIKVGLNEAIGTLDDEATDDTVIGSLKETQDGMATQVGALNQARDDLKDGFDSSLLGQLGGSVDDIGELAAILRAAARPLGGDDQDYEDLPDIEKALDDMDDVLERAQGELHADDGVAGIFGDLHATASEELVALSSTGTAARQVADTAAEVCTLAAEPGTDGQVDRGRYHEVSLLLVGADCDGDVAAEGTSFGPARGASYSDDVSDRVELAVAALQEIRDLSNPDPGSGSVAAAAIADLHTELESVRSTIADLKDEDELPNKNAVRTLLRAIFSLEDGKAPYYGPGGPAWPYPKDLDFENPDPASAACQRVSAFTLPTTTPDPLPAGYVAPDPLDMMLVLYAKMACNQADIDDDIDAAFTAGTNVLATTSLELEAHKRAIDAARHGANDRVDVLVESLTSALDDSAGAIRTQGKRSVTTQNEQLDGEKDTLARSLDRRVAASIRRIESTVGSANRNLEASERALLSDLNEVLLDLGDRSNDGTGLLGALVKGAADTGTAGDSVVRANQTASEFAGVRSTALEDVFLQQAQLARSLELLEAFPVFGIEVPEGSSTMTVFSYELGGN